MFKWLKRKRAETPVQSPLSEGTYKLMQVRGIEGVKDGMAWVRVDAMPTMRANPKNPLRNALGEEYGPDMIRVDPPIVSDAPVLPGPTRVIRSTQYQPRKLTAKDLAFWGSYPASMRYRLPKLVRYRVTPEGVALTFDKGGWQTLKDDARLARDEPKVFLNAIKSQIQNPFRVRQAQRDSALFL